MIMDYAAKSKVAVALLASAWIEILLDCCINFGKLSVALLASAWIEIFRKAVRSNHKTVALLASAWIEIILAIWNFLAKNSRTPRECVD